MSRISVGFLQVVLFLWCGLASVSASEKAELVNEIEKRTNVSISLSYGRTSPALPDSLRNLFADDLTLEEALQIAFANSPRFFASMEELGIAKADVLEATLLKNPKFSGFARSPNHDGQTNLEFEISIDAMNWLLMPLKRRVSKSGLEKTRFRIMDAAVELRSEVKKAYYEVQATEQMFATQSDILQAAQAAAELAARQFKAGNIKEMDLAQEKAAALQAENDYDIVQSVALSARELLSRLLGFSGEDAKLWKVKVQLAEPPSSILLIKGLEELAVSSRYDLLALKMQAEENHRRLTAERFGFLKDTQVGLNTERETDGSRLTGPMWETQVPILDWNQASINRAKSAERLTRYEVQDFELKIRSDVRLTYNRLQMAAFRADRYKKQILPLRARIVELMQLYYNYMLKGVYQLLEVRKQEIEATHDYIRALQDYWTAYAELERAVGGKLPEISTRTMPISNSPLKEIETEKRTKPAQNHGGHT